MGEAPGPAPLYSGRSDLNRRPPRPVDLAEAREQALEEIRKQYPPLLTSAHVAELMQCTIGEVRDQVHRGDLAAVRGGQQFRFFREHGLGPFTGMPGPCSHHSTPNATTLKSKLPVQSHNSRRVFQGQVAIRSGVVGTPPVDLVFGSTLDFDFRFPVDVVGVDWLLAA